MPADPLSDIDLALFVREPDRLLRDETWIARLGPYWTSHLESNALGSGEERRVLFEDGQDVDFAVFPAEHLSALVKEPSSTAVLRRGFRTLVNKDEVVLATPREELHPSPPSSSEFSNLVNDYWFHLVWTAKKLRRGELLTAMEATNGYLRALLVRAVRWHALARGPGEQDVWHGSRFFESWADPRVIRDFPKTVARYDARSVAEAVRANRTMFSWLSHELATTVSFPAPIRDESGLSAYLDRLLRDGGK
jgi:aminoglycoside 6-adenylyltransferase